MNSANVIVNILVNASTANAGLQGYNQIMLQITATARQAATQSANSFSTIFGANFFAGLASNMVSALVGGFRSIVSESVQAASKLESALTGVGSVARNLGFNDRDVIAQVRNLDLVKNGLLTVADAATTTKNLLASGFSLPETINLIKGFGDTAAFGRQAALSFGQAIVSGSEGIKNGNSILVDNLGITKNLSVILKEAGKSETDVMNVRQDASVRLALYNGLLKEANLNQGDATRLLGTTQGALVQIDSAYQRFLQSLGTFIVQNEAVKASLNGIVSVLDFMGQNVGAVIALTTSFTVLATVVALTATNFSSLTIAQIANAAASTNLTKLIQAAIIVMQDFRYITALTAGEIALLSGGLLAIVGVIGAVAYALYSYNSAQKETVKMDKEALTAAVARKNSLNTELIFLNQLSPSVNRNATEQSRLNQIYAALNPESKTRVGLIQDETEKTKELIAEKQKLAAATSIGLQAEGTTRIQTLADAIKAQTLIESRVADYQRQFANAQNQAALSNGGDPTLPAPIKESFISTIQAANEQLGKQKSVVTETAKSVAEYNQITGQTAEKTVLLAGTTNKLGVENNILKKAIDGVSISQNQNATATNVTTSAIRKQITEYEKLTDAADRAKKRNEVLSSLVTRLAEDFANQNKTTKYSRSTDPVSNLTPKQFLENELRRRPELQGIINDAQRVKEAKTAIEKIIDPTKEKKQKSELELLTDSVKKLNSEILSYTNLSSKEFKLRFEKEELERTKRDFENILNLRRELGVEMSRPLPSGAAAARAEIEQLERVKGLRDSILKTARETQDAEDKLLLARITSGAAVVSAQTRADTAYLEGLRGRRDAEAQLSADIIGEIRRRENQSLESVRNVQRLEADAYREFLQAKNDRADEDLKANARLAAALGETFANNPLVSAAEAIAKQPKPDVSPVVAGIGKSNDLLTEILAAVKASGGVGGSGIGGGSVVPITAKNSQGEALGRAAAMLGVSPVDLAAIIGYESKGTFSTGVWGGKGGNYQGLIQFGSAERSKYKVSGNQSFEEQLINSVVPFLRDRFAGVGRKTQGATLLDLYKTINGGNPTVSENTSDGNGTIATHVQRIAAQYIPVALKRFFSPAGQANAVPTTAVEAASGAARPARRNSAFGSAVSTLAGATFTPTNPAETFAQENFGVGLNGISAATKDSLTSYITSLKEFEKYGTTNAVVQDRLNQLTNVNIKQKEELSVTETRINNLLRGDSITVREALNESEIQRGQNYAAALKTLIQTNDYINKISAGDVNIIGQVITEADATRAQATAKAYQDIVVAKDFLSKYAANDATVIENLRKSREASRGNALTGLTVDVDNLRAQARAGGRDSQIERLNAEKEYYSALVAVGKTEAEIEQFRALRGNDEYVRATRANGVLNEQFDITRRLAALEDERASSPVNQALRERLAIETELSKIRRADLEAGEDSARAYVRIADQTTYHSKQANAAVLEHIASAKSLTEIYGDAKIAIVDKVWSATDAVFDKLTNKIPVVGSIIRDLLSSLAKLALNRILLKILGLDPTATLTGSAAGGGTSGGGSRQNTGFNPLALLSGIFSGGGAGQSPSGGFGTGQTTAPFNPNSGINFGNFSAGGGAGAGSSSIISRLPFIFGGLSGSANPSGETSNRAGITVGGDVNSTRPRIVQTGGDVIGQLLKGGKFSDIFKGIGFGKSAQGTSPFAQALPLLAGSLGYGAAGGGLTGIAGAAGGLLLGAGLTSATGIFAAGAGGAAGGSLGFLAPLFSNPITAIAGAGILVGSIVLGSILKRNKVRKEEEKQRTAILVDSKSQMQKVLEDLRKSSNPADIESALNQAATIRQNYLTQVGKLTDSKTRNIAVQTVRELDSIINQIKGEGSSVKSRARRESYAAAFDNALVPTFDGGGMFNYVSANSSTWRNSANDSRVAAFNPTTEAILSRRDIYALGGYNVLKQKGIKGAEMYSSPVTQESAYQNRQSGSGGGASGGKPVLNVIVFSEAEKQAVAAKAGGRYILQITKPFLAAGQDDGWLDLIESKFAGE
jgi:hypothetical protein